MNFKNIEIVKKNEKEISVWLSVNSELVRIYLDTPAISRYGTEKYNGGYYVNWVLSDADIVDKIKKVEAEFTDKIKELYPEYSSYTWYKSMNGNILRTRIDKNDIDKIEPSHMYQVKVELIKVWTTKRNRTMGIIWMTVF
jgi:hypothetical protein